MNKSDRFLPNARKSQLITRKVAGELLIYDRKSDRAHCLNPAGALIWTHCDGQTTVKTMVRLLKDEMNLAVDTEVVWFALEQLRKADLLEASHTAPPASGILTRRSAVLRLGVAAAVTVPFIRSITAPTAAQAATCLPPGAGCVSNGSCCSNSCVDNGRGAFECA